MPFFEKARPTFRVERLSCSGQRESATAHKLSNRLAKAALDRQPRFRNDDGESAGGLAFSELDFSEDLDVFRNTLEQGCVVAIDLTEVDLVDRDAVTLLARTEGNGIELRHCPAYREWVTRERGRR
jgi:hypothetical protein